METVADNKEEAKDLPAEDPKPVEEEKVLQDPNTQAEPHQVPAADPPVEDSKPTPPNPALDLSAEKPANTQTSPPSSPRVHISLKSPTHESTKRSNLHLEIAESLFDRKLQIEAKITKLRVQKKANEINTLQSVPTINKKSKMLASASPSSMVSKEPKAKTNGKVETQSASEDSFLQLIPDSPKSINQSKATKKIKEHAEFDNSELIKSAAKLRENLPERREEPKTKKLSLTARNKISKEKKITKIKEAEQERKVKELEGCTFKPKILNSKNQISESGTCIIKRSNSGSILKNDQGTPASPRANRAVLEFFESFQLSEAKTYTCLYTQMSPVSYHVKHKHGYDIGDITAKAKPMVDYRMVAGNLLE